MKHQLRTTPLHSALLAAVLGHQQRFVFSALKQCRVSDQTYRVQHSVW
jgi:hypothetical protein